LRLEFVMADILTRWCSVSKENAGATEGFARY